MVQPSTGKLLVKVDEPEIRYTGGFGWMRHDNTGWDINDDTLKYNNVKLRVNKSEDSTYHVTVFKYSCGSDIRDAQMRADEIGFRSEVQDNILSIGSGLRIASSSKFRAQGVIVEVLVPVGKKIQFDESIIHAYNPWVVRKNERYYRDWRRNSTYTAEWDYDYSWSFDPDVEYVMTSEEKLVKTEKVVFDSTGVHEVKEEKDRLRDLEEKERKNEKERQEIEREKNRLHLNDKKNDSSSTGYEKPKRKEQTKIYNAFSPLII